jgi:hypothetical protein
LLGAWLCAAVPSLCHVGWRQTPHT